MALMPPLHGLRRHLIAVFGLVSVLTVIGYLIWSGHREAEYQAEQASQNYAALIVTRLDATFRRAEAHIIELARDLPHAAISKNAVPRYADRIDSGLDLRRLNFPELVGLRVFDADGDLLYASESKTTKRVNIRDRDYYKVWLGNTRDDVFFSAAVVSIITGRPAMFVAKPVRDQNGKLVGVVSASIELEYFQQLFQSMTIGRDGAIAVYRTDNFRSVMRWPPIKDWLNTELPPTTPTRIAIASGKTSGTLTLRSAADGVERIYSFRVLDNYPFVVAAGIGRHAALAGWRLRSSLVGSVSMLLIVLLLATVYSLSQAEFRLQELNSDLERRVASRTEELERARVAAEDASLAKSQFLTNMSHEIRTPMNGIVGMIDLLRLEGVTPMQADRLETIDQSARHLLGVLSSILDISKIEAGKFVIEEGHVSLAGILHTVQTMLAERARSRNIELQIDAPELPANLGGDSTRIQQALLNYANNAVKFTNAGKVVLRCRIEADRQDSVLARFEVEDTGIGVPPEAVGRLFSAFEQADNSATRRHGGTGLGLAITKRLAELMGGDVGVESVEGRGSKFWFTVPLRKIDAQSVPTPPRTKDAESLLRGGFAGQLVLVVDDDPVNREIAETLVRSVGFSVHCARDGEEAIKRATTTMYSAILMDIQMPGVDGIEATRRIRKHGLSSTTPIIAMTAHAFLHEKAVCIASGMDDFLTKPFRADELFAILLRTLSQGPHGRMQA